MPDVFKVPIRLDIIQKIHKLVALSQRQPHGTKPDAGNQTSARSWGTGRALARIPRVKGAGTMRAGQAACGNMCRGGRMFAPLKIWRKWYRKSNMNEKRHAIASAIAASGVSALVMARGHRISNIPEIPFVLNDEMETYKKTKQAYKLLKDIGAKDDLDKVKNTITKRGGKSKWRNRRYRRRTGPLIVYNTDEGIVKAFRNIPGVDLCHVRYLNILKLAPGSHMGRFIIWTKSAFEQLDTLFGTYNQKSLVKKRFSLPQPIMQNFDLEAIINSDEIQSKVQCKPVSYQMLFKGRMKKKRILDDSKLIEEINPVESEIREKRNKHAEKSKERHNEIREAFKKNMQILETAEN